MVPHTNVDTENFEDLYEHAPCGYVSFLSDGSVIKINQTLLSWLGLERAEVISKLRFQDFLPVGEQIFFETQIGPLLQVQGVAREINFNLLNKARQKIPVLTTTKQFEFSDKNLKVNRMTVFDITDRKSFEVELMLERKKAQRAAKAKADFLSMFSHEIRTPLNAVIGVSNLLDATTLSPEQQPFMDMLRSSSDNLLNLLNSILDLSKIESGKIALEAKQFHVRRFFEGNILAWQALALNKGIQVAAEIESAVPHSAIGDPVKLTQILSNLIGNAIKFTSSGSVTLKVLLESFDGVQMKIKLEVRDTGIGIAPQRLQLIFDEFSQAEYETTSFFGGTGLGLTIAQKLANLMGSNIIVESELGHGSCFSFVLALRAGEANVDTHGIERVANQTNALFGLSVLVADDSVDNMTLMKHLFKKWGASVETAKNGREALEQIERNVFDVVLMDVRMPVMNGYDAALAIRALTDPVKKATPIIAFSGSTSFDGHDLSEPNLFNTVIGKPFKPAELISKLLPYSKV